MLQKQTFHDSPRHPLQLKFQQCGRHQDAVRVKRLHELLWCQLAYCGVALGKQAHGKRTDHRASRLTADSLRQPQSHQKQLKFKRAPSYIDIAAPAQAPPSAQGLSLEQC